MRATVNFRYPIFDIRFDRSPAWRPPTIDVMNQIREQYADQGFAVLEGVVPETELQSIRSAAAQIVDAFDIDRHHTTFSTKDSDRGRDRYFMDSAQAVHCFLEEDLILSPSNKLSSAKFLFCSKLVKMLSECQTAWIQMRRRVFFCLGAI